MEILMELQEVKLGELFEHTYKGVSCKAIKTEGDRIVIVEGTNPYNRSRRAGTQIYLDDTDEVTVDRAKEWEVTSYKEAINILYAGGTVMLNGVEVEETTRFSDFPGGIEDFFDISVSTWHKRISPGVED